MDTYMTIINDFHTLISNSLDIDFIDGDIHDQSCKNIHKQHTIDI